MLCGVHFFFKAFKRVFGRNFNRFLVDDFSAVEFVIYKMHRAPRYFYSAVKRLFYGVLSLERRQEARVQVYDFVRVF